MITYHNLNPEKYLIEQEEKITFWLHQVIENEGNIPGEITYIFGTDEYINEINRKYLNHDTYTDIITFQQSENQMVKAIKSGSEVRVNGTVIRDGDDFRPTKIEIQ